ncbi:MAG: transposase [Thermomicrobiales bacterium]
MVPGYPTLTLLGLGGGGRRGILDHRLYSAQAGDFVSVPALTRQMIMTTGKALAAWAQPVTLIMDRGFDDQAILATAWRQGWQTVWRVQHRDRLVRAAPDGPTQPLAALAQQTLMPIGRIEAEMLVQKTGQVRPKRQPVTVALRSCPIQVPVRWRSAPGEPEELWEQRCWLVEAALLRTEQEPWWLLTDRPVETELEAITIFRMYAQRWAIEDTFKLVKDALGQESVQVLGYDAIRMLDALAWVAQAYLEELGVGLDHDAIRFLRRLGGEKTVATGPWDGRCCCAVLDACLICW